MAEKNDWTKLSKRELLEMLQRQEKLLANKKFLQSLPDKGKKVTETVKQLKGLIAQKDKLEDTVAQFERLTVSQLVQRTQLHVLDSDDSDDNEVLSGANHQDTSVDLHEQLSNSKHRKSMDTKSSSGTWDYESSATPPTYKLEKTKPISLEESFELLQEQEKRQKDLQAQHATMKLREQTCLAKTDYRTLKVLNPLQYRERVQDDYSSDDSEPEENVTRPHEMDSDDDIHDDN